MPKSSKTSKQMDDEFKFLQGGTLPESDVKRHLAELKQKLSSEFNEKTALRQQAAKYASQIASPAEAPDSAKATQAIKGLRQFTEKLSKRKLAAPRKLIVPPIWWGTYTLRFTPYYSALGTYDLGTIQSETGDPTVSVTGDDDLGQLSCSVATNYESPSSATAFNMMGVYFKPIFSQATVRVSFDSEIAFYWYVNSIKNKEAISEAQGLIELYQYDGAFLQPALRRGAFLGWAEVGLNSLDFDIVSEAGPTWSLEAPVNSSYWYFVVISLSCSATGTGWPGSLAGANATVTVPSITVTVTANQVLQNA
jgi:hypothetical protein